MSEMLEKILSNENIEKAYKRVYANKGAGGVDGVTTKELEEYMEEAVKVAAEVAGEGDIVFMSPASASFDMYKNFEERGNHFRDLVLALSE